MIRTPCRLFGSSTVLSSRSSGNRRKGTGHIIGSAAASQQTTPARRQRQQQQSVSTSGPSSFGPTGTASVTSALNNGTQRQLFPTVPIAAAPTAGEGAGASSSRSNAASGGYSRKSGSTFFRQVKNFSSRLFSTPAKTQCSSESSLGAEAGDASPLHHTNASEDAGIVSSLHSILGNSSVTSSSSQPDDGNAASTNSSTTHRMAQAAEQLKLLQEHSEARASWDVHARVLLNRGYVLYLLGGPANTEEAIRLLREVLHLHASMGHHAQTVHIHCMLGTLYGKGSGAKDGYAEQCFKVAIRAVEHSSASADQSVPGDASTSRLDPLLPSLCYARHLHRLHRNEEAIRELSKCISGTAQSATRCEAVLLLSRCLKEQRSFSDAAALLRRELPAVGSEILDNGNTLGDNVGQSCFIGHSPSMPQLAAECFAELGGYLHYHEGNIDEATAMYEAAVEISLGLVRKVLAHHGGANFTHPDVRSAVRLHAEILYNAGICMLRHKAHGASSAVGILEESIKLLHRVNYDAATLRMRLQYARVLRQLDVVDEALVQYFAALDAAQQQQQHNPCSSAGCEASTIGEHFQAGRDVSVPEIHAHLAHCLHFNAGDFARAQHHYTTALSLSQHPKAVAIAARWAHAAQHDTTAHSAPSPVGEDDLVSTPRLRADTLSWVLECTADCLRRLHRNDDAIELLELRLDIGRSVGDVCASALFALSGVLERMPSRIQDAKQVFDEMIALPQDALTTVERCDLVSRYATFAHYSLQDFEKAARLYQLALELDNMNPVMLVQYAWCVRQLPPDMQLTIDEQIQQYENAIVAMEIWKAESAANERRHQHSSADPNLPDVAKQYPVPVFDEVYVLGEVAMFYHDVLKDTVQAEAMYRKALEIPGTPGNPTVHVLANYAVLKYYVCGEYNEANTLFQRALAINPNNFVVSNLYADFLINANGGDESASLQHIRRMVDLFPEHVSTIYHKLARLEDRLGNMGNEESRMGALLSYMVAASGDKSLCLDDLSDERVVAILVHCSDQNVVSDALAFIQCKLKALPLAERCYAAIYPRVQNHTYLLLNYGRLSVDVGNTDRAMKLFTEAFCLDPTDPLTVEQYADFIASTRPDQATAAERLHLACLERHRTTGAAHLAYAIFLTLHLPSPSVATKHFKLALTLQPKDPNVWSQYASFAERQAVMVGVSAKGHADIMFEAENAFKTACELSGESAIALLALGLFYMRAKRSSEAWRYLQSAYDKEPNNGSIVSACAIFLHDRHNTRVEAAGSSNDASGETKQLSELADKLYKKSLKIDPSDLHVVKQYIKFLDEVLRLPQEASKWQEHADQLALKREKQPLSSGGPETESK